MAHPRRSWRGRRAAAVPEFSVHIRPGCLQRRRQAAERGGNDGDHAAEREHAPVHAELNPVRRLGPERADDRTRQPKRRQQSDYPASRCQDQAFGEDEADDTAAGSTERQTDGKLAAALQRPREEQVGDIRAGDEQHESNRAKEYG